MKKIIYFISAIIIWIGFSCEENQPILVKHTRFSIAYIQEVDTDGAQFSANVYEYGTDEILEYGFVFGANQFPTISNSDVVKQSGKPDQLFSLKAKHGMKLGATYYVAAYVKTQNGITYCKIEKFTSKGSVGFLVETIDIPNPAYFGDTITIRGKNFSRLRTNYEVKIESSIALVTEVGDDFMKFTIPSNIVFSENQNAFITTVKVAEKEFRAELKIDFRDPVFRLKDTRKILFTDTIFIEGDYLESSDFEIQYDGKERGISKLPLVFQDLKRIGFRPEVEFFEKKPLITLKIRGKKYPLQNTFELLPTEFVPGQVGSISSEQGATATISNVNPFNENLNKLVSSTHDEFWWEITGDKINIRFNFPSERQIEFYFWNQGVKGSVPFKVTNGNPNIKFMPAYLGYSVRAVFQNETGFYLTNKGIWEFSPENKRVVLHPVNGAITAWQEIFTLAAPNGKIYIGNQPPVLNSGIQDFYVFDPQTKQVSKLPPIPTANLSPQGVYATQEYLYYEAAEFYDENGRLAPPAVYRYEFSSTEWKKLEWKHSHNYLIQFPTFYHKGKLYGMAVDSKTQKSFLKVFDSNSASWSKVADVGYYGEFYAHEMYVIDDYVYGSFLEGMVRFALGSGNEKQYSFLGKDFNNIKKLFMVVLLGGKFYVYNDYDNVIHEYDPNYFPD